MGTGESRGWDRGGYGWGIDMMVGKGIEGEDEEVIQQWW